VHIAANSASLSPILPTANACIYVYTLLYK